MSAEDRPVTFTEDVAPIVFDHCVSCHQPDGVAPMSLTTYEEVRSWARAIRQAVVTRAMPPWKADQGDVAFLGDRRLSEASSPRLPAGSTLALHRVIRTSCRRCLHSGRRGHSVNRI